MQALIQMTAANSGPWAYLHVQMPTSHTCSCIRVARQASKQAFVKHMSCAFFWQQAAGLCWRVLKEGRKAAHCWLQGPALRCSCTAVLADLCSLLQAQRRRLLARQRRRCTQPLRLLSATPLSAGPPQRHWRTALGRGGDVQPQAAERVAVERRHGAGCATTLCLHGQLRAFVGCPFPGMHVS